MLSSLISSSFTTKRKLVRLCGLIIVASVTTHCPCSKNEEKAKQCTETHQNIGGLSPRGRIIGSNDIELVSNSLLTQDSSVAGTRHIGRMSFRKPSAPSFQWQCTAFMISKHYALTAAHCVAINTQYAEARATGLPDRTLDIILDGTGANPNAAYVEFNRLQSDFFPAAAGTPVRFYVSNVVHYLTHDNGRNIDAALIRLSDSPNLITNTAIAPGEAWGYFNHYSFQNFRRPTQLYRAGFGIVGAAPYNGQFMHVDRSSNCNVTSECLKDLNHTTLGVPYLCDTKGGDSGAPVVDKDTGIVFGINTSEASGFELNYLINIASLQYWWDQRAPWGVFDAVEGDF